MSIIHYDKDVLLKVSSWINITIEMWETVWQDDNALKLIGNIFLHIAVQRVHGNSNIKQLWGSCTDVAGISVSAALKETGGTIRCTVLTNSEVRWGARRPLGWEKSAQVDVGLIGQHHFPSPVAAAQLRTAAGADTALRGQPCATILLWNSFWYKCA